MAPVTDPSPPMTDVANRVMLVVRAGSCRSSTRVQQEHVEAAGHAGDDPGEHEARSFTVRGRHGGGVGGPLVVAGGDEHPAGPGLAHALGGEDRPGRGRPGRTGTCTYPSFRSKRSHRRGRSTPLGRIDGKLFTLRKYWSRATARARVVTARNRPLMRRAGRPTSSDTTAPARPAATSTRNMSVLWADEQVAGHQGADADDGELAEADVPAPAGEHHQRHRRHRPHDGQRGQELVGRAPRVRARRRTRP